MLIVDAAAVCLVVTPLLLMTDPQFPLKFPPPHAHAHTHHVSRVDGQSQFHPSPYPGLDAPDPGLATQHKPALGHPVGGGLGAGPTSLAVRAASTVSFEPAAMIRRRAASACLIKERLSGK